MPKQLTITNLIVMPLLASAIFLASPALANNSQSTIDKEAVINGTNVVGGGNASVAGTVTSINEDIIVVKSPENVLYTVDASNATIMKASRDPSTNPLIINIKNIHVGDTVMVRGRFVLEKD